jgi:hypothetical protein
VAELRLAGIDDLSAANRYIAQVFLPEMNRQFSRAAAEEGSAFVSAAGADLDRSFAIRHEGRVVANDNPVRVNNLALQIEKSRFRDHFVKCRVEVFEHLDGRYSVVWKKRGIGRDDSQGRALGSNPGGRPPDPRGLSPWGPEKRKKWERGRFPLPPLPRTSRRRSGRSPALPYPPARPL